MAEKVHSEENITRLGLDMGVFAVKGVLTDNGKNKYCIINNAGEPLNAASRCIQSLLEGRKDHLVRFALVGCNAGLLAKALGIKPVMEIEALQSGLDYLEIDTRYLISLGHENMYYLEVDEARKVEFFSRNGQCAAGSGAFWYQQATRMGYNDRELAKLALEAETPVPISGRCAVFAKSDMTHAINEGATQSAVSAGMAKALVETVVTGVAQNRIKGPGTLYAVGGVAANKAVLKYLRKYAEARSLKLTVPELYLYINALGAATKGTPLSVDTLLGFKESAAAGYVPEKPLDPLDPGRVKYLEEQRHEANPDLSRVYMGVDCGSVSTKCLLLDAAGLIIGGIYLPTTGRPALQVLELMKQVERRYGAVIQGAPITACTTGSGRFLSQKILNAEYAVDEITCQAEGVKYLFDDSETLSVIEIGGEDSKFLQLKDGLLYDYNMNPVCAAGTGTFLENLAELLGINIRKEFSAKAFQADYAIDLGDICTLISQSILVSEASQGLPLDAQLASLAYSSARNYLSKTVDQRPLEGKLVFTGATARNHALASALAAESGKDLVVPPMPELTGALGAALAAKMLRENGEPARFSFRSLRKLNSFFEEKKPCKASCHHNHNCILHVISFSGGEKFIYGDRCGRYSGLENIKERADRTDYALQRDELFCRAAGETSGGSTTVGLARCGLFYDLYPFWASFFRELGVRTVITGETRAKTLEWGKEDLDSEMCYPMKVVLGHYRELAGLKVDYIFLPEVVDMAPLPWAECWPRSFTCPLLQTLRGTVVNSLDLDEKRILYAQLNYRSGPETVKSQLKPVAERLLGGRCPDKLLSKAVTAGYNAMKSFQLAMEEESRRIMDKLQSAPGMVTAVFLSRSYTLYDRYVSKNSLDYAGSVGVTALPQDFLIAYLQGWYEGRYKSPYLDPFHDEFKRYLKEFLDHVNHIYPAQLQKMLSAALLANFLNRKREETGLPHFNLVLQDPFKCGPNAMLRHFLTNLGGYLRLTLDEHTAAAGLITRLEAFKNTCLSQKSEIRPVFFSPKTTAVPDRTWKKILIPEPTHHARVFAAVFRRFGIEADTLPRSKDPDMSLARRYANGEECLPFIQNLQDYLEYLEENGSGSSETVFFQGWASGPCRYGLYAQAQSMAINRAGYGKGKVCAVKFQDTVKQFGPGFALIMFNGTLALDILYKMLHRTRPYEVEKGSAWNIFKHYSVRLTSLLEKLPMSLIRLTGGSYLRPLEDLLKEAAASFAGLPQNSAQRPVILVGGEFYVRLDDRCNDKVIEKIESAGGEVNFAPVSEVFTYTAHVDYREACQTFLQKKNPSHFLQKSGYGLINRIAHRDEVKLERAASAMLNGLEEPTPQEIMNMAHNYISEHYGGEPPMTIGRAAAFAGRSRVAGAVFVAPFTCMPGSYVEAQQGLLYKNTGIPAVTVYYDGKKSAHRNEVIEALVYQARQKLGLS